MKRVTLVRAAAFGVTALSLALAAGDASAQASQLPPSTPPAAAEEAPPATSAPTATYAPAGTAAPVAGGAVRVHFRTEKAKGTARIYLHRQAGWVPVCTSPCTADIPVNSELRATLANNDDEPHTFIVSGEAGPELDLEVRKASSGSLIAGIVLMGSGGAFVLGGLLYLALADLKSDGYGGSSSLSADTYKTTGFVCIGLGAAAAVTGAVLLLTRSHEPRTFDATHGVEIYGRGETLLGDVAVARPRDAATRATPAFTPLGYSFAF